LTQGVYSMVLGVFMVCIMASTMFLGAKISWFFTSNGGLFEIPSCVCVCVCVCG
jgi:hypothetical protein